MPGKCGFERPVRAPHQGRCGGSWIQVLVAESRGLDGLYRSLEGGLSGIW